MTKKLFVVLALIVFLAFPSFAERVWTTADVFSPTSGSRTEYPIGDGESVSVLEIAPGDKLMLDFTLQELVNMGAVPEEILSSTGPMTISLYRNESISGACFVQYCDLSAGSISAQQNIKWSPTERGFYKIVVSVGGVEVTAPCLLLAYRVWYVDAATGADTNGGVSNVVPFRTIQKAVDAAIEGDVVLVGDGRYEPITTSDKIITIKSVNGPEKTFIDGGGTNRCATLSIKGTAGGIFESGYEIVSRSSGTTLSGFCLENGYVGNTSVDETPYFGAGALGGLIKNCIIRNCYSLQYGGGVCWSALERCVVSNCVSMILGGGGVWSSFDNCLIVNNALEGWPGDGGGCCDSIVRNSTVVGNHIPGFDMRDNFGLFGQGGNMAGTGYQSHVFNSIVWDNYFEDEAERYYEQDPDVWKYSQHVCTMESSCIPGDTESVGIINADPCFRDPDHGNYRLQPWSPCINAGTNVVSHGSFDLDNNSRVYGTSIDMGAYEYCLDYESVSIVTFEIGEHAQRTGGGELVQIVTNYYAAVAPELSANTGWLFFGWDRDFSLIVTNLTVTAKVRQVGDNVVLLDGDIASNRTLDATKVYLVLDSVRVMTGATLTIPPKTVIKFCDGASLAVKTDASCIAESAVFTHVLDDTIGGVALVGERGTPKMDAYKITGDVQDDAATEYRYTTPTSVTLSGTFTKSETWKGYKVYHVTGDLTIPNGVTLTVEPGAVVKFDAGKSLTIASGGRLDAQGTRAQPIVFTSIKDDDNGGDTNGDGDATKPDKGEWSKISTSGGTANMSHVQILYASKNSTTGAINMNGGMVTFNYGIIAHCAYDAIGVESGDFSMSNSIIYDALTACRHWPKKPIVNCVIYDCGRLTQGGGQTFVNCVFSRITELWEAFGFPQNNTSYKNCCFWNKSGSVLVWKEGYTTYTEDALVVCGKDGNIWADPLFVDAANGDFRLQEGSPCIDAGNGSYAPTTDYYGQTRQTVRAASATGTKAANGNYPDIGIYEFMPREVAADVDLTVTSVTAPTEMTVGEKVSISWTVKNIGTAYATGSWRDKAEIVCANGTAIEMGEKTVTATLAPGAEKEFTAVWTIPSAQAGTVHVRVTANAERDIFEGTLGANNAYTLETDIALALPKCDIPSDGTAAKFSVPANGNLSYALGEDFAAGGLLVVKSAKSVTVRTGNGQLPTADTYHAAAVQIADGQWLVSVPEGGKAYVEIENDTSDAASVEVSFKEGAFAFYDTGATVTFTKDCGSDLVLTAYGNGFTSGGRGATALPDDMTVALVGAGNVIAATDVLVSDSGTKAVVTFADSDCMAGEYHLRFTKNGQTLVQDGNPITIQNRATGAADILGKMEYSLEMTETVRQGREYMGYIVYGNVADKGICAAPYLRVTASNGSYVRFSQSDAWSSQLELMGISQSYPASQVKAGESIKVPFYYKTTSSSADIKLGVASSADGDFPWETNGRYMRPSWANDEFWGLAFAILKANVGTSWGDWIARMRHNADYLMKLGKATYRLEPLWQLDVNEALGVDHAVSSLAGGTDLARSGRGLGLALRRSYGAAFYSRFKSGVFGYGWSDNYSAWAELQDSGSTLALHSGSGSTYRFYKVNGAWTPEDARDKTKVMESSSEYVLTYRSGTVQRIAKSNMRVASITDNQGNAIAFTYAGGQLSRVSHTDGQSLFFTYENDKLVSATDDQGRTARYGYDGDLLTSVTAFNGLVTRYAYYPADGTPTSRALRQITYPDGNTKDFTYDAAGRIATAAVNGNLMLTEIVRGEFGSYKTIAPNGGVSSVSVGVSGEVLETVNALGQKVTRTYTDDTLLESLIGPTGKRSKIAYDADGNAVKATDAAGTQTSFAYTSDYGALAKVTDARGNAFNYGYDKLGRSEQISYADDSSERIEYSARGDIVKSVNRRGQSVEYAYDAEGNVLSETWETGRVLTWLYDDRGNCTNACDSETGAVTMEYDANERLMRIAYPNGHGFTYAYDALGRTTARTSFDGFAQKYEYDALGRLKKLTDGDGNPYLENVYDETTGQLWLMKYGNGTIVSNAYDILGRTVGIYHFTNDSSATVGSAPRADRLAAFFEYAYDTEGRRISQTTTEGVERYTYDTVGQLTDVTYPDGTEEHFRYDAVGNRLTANGDTYEVNNLNQYTRISTSTSTSTSFTYDADGNMTSKTHPTDGTTTYTYDIQNRLIAVTNETKDIRWACVYDVFGNRVKVIDHDTATEKVFVQGSLPSVVEEYANGARTQRHVLSGAVRLADIATDGAMSYYHADSLGSLRLATDASGVTTATSSYKAFGAERTVGSAPRADRPAGWIGTLGVDYDAATGLYFMRNRYYDAESGRFVSRDPIGLMAGDINIYSYCQNEPLMFIDPNGLFQGKCIGNKMYWTDGIYAGTGSCGTGGNASQSTRSAYMRVEFDKAEKERREKKRQQLASSPHAEFYAYLDNSSLNKKWTLKDDLALIQQDYELFYEEDVNNFFRGVYEGGRKIINWSVGKIRSLCSKW